MSKKINLYWYKHNEGHGNFGDELNPYIISEISTNQINYFDVKLIFENKWIGIKTLSYKFLKKELSIFSFFQLLISNFIKQPKILFSIGSILQYNSLENLTVWGSGIVKKDVEFSNANFLAVRGKFTQKRIRELGYLEPKVLGDPAILLPLIYKPKEVKNYKIGIIPHYVHYDYLKHLKNENIIVINLLDPIEKVIDEINSCNITLSTSLHGIIVSHAYGLPSIWSKFSGIESVKLAGDDIKFRDYFSSVDLKFYDPLIFIKEESIFDQLDIIDKKYSIIPNKEKLKDMQNGLLKVFPYALKNKYQNLIK